MLNVTLQQTIHLSKTESVVMRREVALPCIPQVGMSIRCGAFGVPEARLEALTIRSLECTDGSTLIVAETYAYSCGDPEKWPELRAELERARWREVTRA